MHSYTGTEALVAMLLLCYLFANMVFNNCFYPYDAQEGLAEVQAIHQKELPTRVKMQHHQQYLPIRRHEVCGAEQRMLLLVLTLCVHQQNGNKGIGPPTSLPKIWRVATCLRLRACQLLCKPF